MKKKKPLPGWVIAILIVWSFIILNVILAVLRPPSVTQNEIATDESTLEATTDEKDLTTEDIIRAKIKELNIKCSDLTVYQDDPDKPQYIIRYHSDGEFWDETDFIADCISNYIKLCEDPFHNGNADKIEYIVYCDMTDARGNKDESKAFDMCMLKGDYNKYNWENLLSTTVNYDLLSADCQELYIHPGIKKNIKFDRLHYR